MTYLLMILLAALLYGLARVVVNDIKDHITKEIDRVIISLKTGNYVSDNLVHPEFKVAKTHERYNVRSKEPILDQPYISINELGIQFLEMIKKDITED